MSSGGDGGEDALIADGIFGQAGTKRETRRHERVRSFLDEIRDAPPA